MTMQKITPFLLATMLVSCAELDAPNSYEDPNWAYYQGDPGRNQYKTFGQINRENVAKLQKVWTYQSEDSIIESGQIQCNPLIIDGILFGTSPQLKLFALDARSGQELWRFDPAEEVDQTFGVGVNRGLNYWSDGQHSRILYSVGPLLFAIDTQTGTPILSFGVDGKVDLKQGLGRNLDSAYYGNNSPGAIFNNLVIIGGRTSEGADHAPGHIRAYDVETGEMAWIFHTIPYPDEFGFDTWPEGAYLYSGGANSWAGFSVDLEAGIVYAPTGSPSFDFYGGDRVGDNLFGNSVIALDANTGQRIWHFQARHHDVWDRDLPAPPNLITVQKDGRRIKALAQISKSGHLFVLDRITGEPIYPIEEVTAPSSALLGEVTSSTQPVPTVYPPFSRTNLTEHDLAIRNDDAAAIAREAYEHAPHGEFQPPSLNRQILFPGMDGGGEWGGAAYDPEMGVLFVNSNEMTWEFKVNEYESKSLGLSIYQVNCQGCHAADRTGNELFGNVPDLTGVGERLTREVIALTIKNGRGVMPAMASLSETEVEAVTRYLLGEEDVVADTSEAFEWPYPYYFDGYKKYQAPDGLPIIRPPWGQLTAIDMNKPGILWQVPLGNIDSLSIEGHPVTGTENYGGPVVTAGGLVFIAATSDEKIRAFDKVTGIELWASLLPAAGYATPATYMVDGKQYVVVACGGGKLGTKSGSSYVCFALPD